MKGREAHMADCSICGKKLGLFDTRKETVKGRTFSICEECGWAIDGVNRANKNGSPSEIKTRKTELAQVAKKCSDSILREHLLELSTEAGDVSVDKAMGESSKHFCPICGAKIDDKAGTCSICGYKLRGVYITKEEKQELNKEKFLQFPKNPLYEYAVECIKDSDVLGVLDIGLLEGTIMQYALNGWRLHTAFSSEIGKNALLGINATVNQTILIFERCIKHADN